MTASPSRVRVIFHGNVQGVGFRYSTRRAATAYPEITGMVRNLPDGTVELIAEGTRQHLDSLLTDIQNAMRAYIRDMTIEYSLGMRQYQSFVIGF